MNALLSIVALVTIARNQVAGITPQKLMGQNEQLKFPPFIDKDTLKFNYPEEINQFSAIFRLEVAASDKKVFHYDITEKTTNCTISLGYFISSIKDKYDNTTLRASLKVYDPKGQLIESIRYKTTAKEQGLASLALNQPGKYKFILANSNALDIVVDLAFGLTECHSIKHKLHQEDLIMFTNRFQTYVMKQTVG